MPGKNFARTFLGCTFWTPIPLKQYLSKPGCGTDHYQHLFPNHFFIKNKLNISEGLFNIS